MTGVPTDRAAYAAAFEPAKRAAFGPGEYAGQESFMSVGEILDLGLHAGVGPGVRVLDLCCGVAGPGRLLTRVLGADYLGVDADPAAVEVARGLAGWSSCRFEVAQVPPLPPGEYDVVLLLETMLAFTDKPALLSAVADGLAGGGRFACTVEVGDPLTATERAAMPDGDIVQPVPAAQLPGLLAEAGLTMRWRTDLTDRHRMTVEAIVAQVAGRAGQIARRVGRPVVNDLLRSHRLWARWLRTGRIRKVALVAARAEPPAAPAQPAGPAGPAQPALPTG